jgi:REP element-mobilizing transposase RayT
MARRLRIQFPGAAYHVINRGNYRRDLFETVGAAKSFENTLGQAGTRFGWEIHAFSLLYNHFHLAVTTPIPNLSDGMHWLQTTFALRFNRSRSERGHLFQGRYQSPLIEDAASLVRVVDYIHLNPVDARIVAASQVGNFRWSSLARFIRGPRPEWLSPQPWLQELGLSDTRDDWMKYLKSLVSLAGDFKEQQSRGFNELGRGWAIGTDAWKRALAREYGHRALEQDLPGDEIGDLKQQRWQSSLEGALRRHGKGEGDIAQGPKCAHWKVVIARSLRKETGAPYRWIAEALAMGSPNSVRVAVCRLASK